MGHSVSLCHPTTVLKAFPPPPPPLPPPQPDVNDNKIPELQRPAQPTVDEVEAVRKSNEIHVLRNGAPPSSNEEQPSNVLMSHASDESIFNKTEVLAGQ